MGHESHESPAEQYPPRCARGHFVPEISGGYKGRPVVVIIDLEPHPIPHRILQLTVITNKFSFPEYIRTTMARTAANYKPKPVKAPDANFTGFTFSFKPPIGQLTDLDGDCVMDKNSSSLKSSSLGYHVPNQSKDSASVFGWVSGPFHRQCVVA